MVVPGAEDDSGSEGASGVHAGAGERDLEREQNFEFQGIQTHDCRVLQSVKKPTVPLSQEL